ncbi:MAG TPA: hypothetical protein VIZ28_07895 [Chitinophagaceae bacterium]
MKFISTLLLCSLFFSASSQQWKLISSYSLGLPREEMGKNIQPAHSLQVGLLHKLPGSLKQLSVGLELGIGAYANERIEQTFQFGNNTASVVPVNYSSNVFNTNLQVRFNLLSDKHYIIPYINAKGGLYNFFSTIVVEDPDDPDGCHALQRDNIINDKTMYWSAGGGLQIDAGMFSKQKEHRSRVLIDISANTIRGGTLDYINTKHLLDDQPVSDPESKPLNVQFINANTQEIHEHKVAQVYTSPLRMLEFRAGVTVLLGNR